MTLHPTNRSKRICLAIAAFGAIALAACGSSTPGGTQPIPAEITNVMQKPVYKNAVWSLQVIVLESGRVVYAQNATAPTLIASVRKLFSVGMALNQLGPDHRFVTPVYRQGVVEGSGTLNGNLVLVASGDLTMGGRTNPDGSLAISNFDHNEANALGNAQLTTPDPLAGYDALAAQVASSGIRRVAGEVVIDDRLFQPFNFRGEFDVRPVFVNDDIVDVIIGADASVDWRPKSAALSVLSGLQAGGQGSALDIELAPEPPNCIGTPNCVGRVTGNLPAGFVPPLTNAYPLIRTFRITEPSNYARTVFIEALARAGVTVTAANVEPNPVQLLPAQNSYVPSTQVAQLVSQPYGDYAKLIDKVSYNIGADMSLMLFGLAADGSTTVAGALAAEQNALSTQFQIPAADLHFIDGSGGGETTATGQAVTTLLTGMTKRAAFPSYFDSLPVLAVDGSLSFVTDFEADPTLAPARGQVHAKTGTYVGGPPLTLKGQALAGYLDAKSGRRLVFFLAVNGVPITSINDVLAVFQDQGTIAAMLWKLQ
ncbi:D-alanyl-D-alanine carboxypeptidase DacC precursor [Caballeronia terrestris]|uniref:D-alanyl-D-alanine carboxypeptidase DacC n=1 Tax=Caballeronia terrestris TaxID=1226301 RepID=A0A158F1M5_9BURK|nr:D-alanyl-D-alanine carboxypeptidase [Caballeronia terrestris]SAL13615.1 D-alanyl-D-alanine carboxypeptidase DacC precursor [Caballeronia terrestris]